MLPKMSQERVTEALFPPILQDQLDCVCQAVFGFLLAEPLAVRAGNLWRTGNEPLTVSFHDCRELVVHGYVFSAPGY